jgi:hypothetical protein
VRSRIDGVDSLLVDRTVTPHWRLIEIHQSGVQALTSSALRADERIVLDCCDLKSAIATIIEQLGQTGRGQRLPAIQLVGADSLSKQLVAQQVAAQGIVGANGRSPLQERYVYRLPVELLPTQASELETVARLWQRESLLLPLALYLDAQEVGGKLPIAAAGSLSRSGVYAPLAVYCEFSLFRRS